MKINIILFAFMIYKYTIYYDNYKCLCQSNSAKRGHRNPSGFCLPHPRQDSEALRHREVIKMAGLDKRIRIEVSRYSDRNFGT